MSFYKNLLLFVLSVQEKILTKKLNKTLGVKHFSKRKNKYNNGEIVLDSNDYIDTVIEEYDNK